MKEKTRQTLTIISLFIAWGVIFKIIHEQRGFGLYFLLVVLFFVIAMIWTIRGYKKENKRRLQDKTRRDR